MRHFNKWIVATIALVIPACIPSLHPLYTESDTRFDPALLGIWVQDKKDSTWEFSTENNKTYRLIFTDKEGRTGEFEARLVKLENQLFLDLFPLKPTLSENGYYQFHLLRVHSFLKVSVDGSHMQLAGMDPRWLQKKLETDPDSINHEQLNKLILLTASPSELKEFLSEHKADEQAFGIAIQLTRQDVSAQ